MARSNGMLAAAAVVAAGGIAAYVGLQEIRDLRQALVAISARLDKTDAAATAANTTAAAAVSKAAEAGAMAAQTKAIADQALALATAARPAASPAPVQPTAAPASSPDIAQGRDLALTICAVCHVVSPDQHVTPTLQPPGPEFRNIANQPTTTERSLHNFIAVPHGKMPDPMLVDYQVTALVAYVLSLRDHR